MCTARFHSQNCIQCSGNAPWSWELTLELGMQWHCPVHHIWQPLRKQKLCQSSWARQELGISESPPPRWIQWLLLCSHPGAATIPTLIHPPIALKTNSSDSGDKSNTLSHMQFCYFSSSQHFSSWQKSKICIGVFQQAPNLPASPTHRYCNLNWTQHEAPSASKDNKAAYQGEKVKEQWIIQFLVFKADLEWSKLLCFWHITELPLSKIPVSTPTSIAQIEYSLLQGVFPINCSF